MKRLICIFITLVSSAILACGQNSEVSLYRRYSHVGGIEHFFQIKLVLKSNGEYKIRNSSSQFRPTTVNGTWEIKRDTLILNERKEPEISKTDVGPEPKKFIITSTGLNVYYQNGNLTEVNYFVRVGTRKVK